MTSKVRFALNNSVIVTERVEQKQRGLVQTGDLEDRYSCKRCA